VAGRVVSRRKVLQVAVDRRMVLVNRLVTDDTLDGPGIEGWFE